jgi:hypothetical protein
MYDFNFKQTTNESENNKMSKTNIRNFDDYASPLRQSEKQRESSEYVERKWLRPVQLSNYNLYSRSAYSNQVRDNRRMMRTVNLNKPNDIRDYTTSIHEVLKKAA